jgi:2-aminoadipate transaminase
MGTFSKTVATGLRIGWILADQGAIDALLQTRYDLGVSPWLQRTLQEYCDQGLWDRHVAKMCDLYRRKRDLMVASLSERCSRYCTWNVPEGGFFLWLDLADSVDPQALAEAARRHGVAYVGGGGFFLDGGGRRSVRLAFSHVSDAEIPEAILRLGRAMEEAAQGS